MLAYQEWGGKRYYRLPDHSSFVRYEKDEDGNIWDMGCYGALNCSALRGFKPERYELYLRLTEQYDRQVEFEQEIYEYNLTRA